MDYNFPDEETLVKYLALLSKVLIYARTRAYASDERSARLLDAVHNVPDLLCRWPDMNESFVLADLEKFEAEYCGKNHPFSEIIRQGPGSDWQLVWKIKPKDSKGEGD